MGSSTLVATISGAVAVIVAALTLGGTYFLTKWREHQTDWRKLKLERYTETVTALSIVVQLSGVTSEDQGRYANAVNSMSLVAPPSVLAALYAFQDELSNRSPGSVTDRADQLLNSLMHVLRQDIEPRRSQETIFIRFMSAPPRSAPPSEIA